MKKILGLDLGTTSIGWALVNEAENDEETSSIIKLGVRVNPLTTDEQDNFEKGKASATNADRTIKRGMRRNLQRYRQRRDYLVKLLRNEGWITDDDKLCEEGKESTYETLRLRATAAQEPVTLAELARVLLAINKKRGYKSNRKAKDPSATGELFDGLAIARELHSQNITPGQYMYQRLQNGKTGKMPFYRSDLQKEYDRIFECQRQYYPDIFTDKEHDELLKNEKSTVDKYFYATHHIPIAEIKSKGIERQREIYTLRSRAVVQQLLDGEVIAVIAEVLREIRSSSGYLNDISERSKELYFEHLTVGQKMYQTIMANRHESLKNRVYYRNDYLDEFERIWSTQQPHHADKMTEELHRRLRDSIIFYQRPLKSKKSELSFCEFESHKIKVGDKEYTTGSRVTPRSSLLFQEFRLRQTLANICIKGDSLCQQIIEERHKPESQQQPIAMLYAGRGKRLLTHDEMDKLYERLCYCEKLTDKEAIKILIPNAEERAEASLNFKEIKGNSTFSALIKAYCAIANDSGHDIELKRLTAKQLDEALTQIFAALGYNTDILHLPTYSTVDEMQASPLFQLWHLLYSYEGDKSATGIEHLIEHLQQRYNLSNEHAQILAGVTFEEDYGSLSNKALLKLLPHMRQGMMYSEACAEVYGTHSRNSLTTEENNERALTEHIALLPKGALRNPVVEKILNQMGHVVNQIIDTYGRPDEIRVEMAREMKKTAKQRADATKAISDNTKKREEAVERLRGKFGIANPSRNDILRLMLYDELAPNGYKTLYSNQHIEEGMLFSDLIDIEHIIPQALMFNDSFQNKTLEFRTVNIEKGKQTAYDYVALKYGADGLEQYMARIKSCGLSSSKIGYLSMTLADIPTDFLNRDLNNTQYIARQAMEMLRNVARTVTATTGSITALLREHWGLIDIMQELNWSKYEAAGMIITKERRNGQTLTSIKNWSKRNDHRHHAMDALTIAFTRPAYINFLNHLTARGVDSKIIDIENRYMSRNEHNKLLFLPPFGTRSSFRQCAKEKLEEILVSIKAKNKVVTRNTNTTTTHGKKHSKVELTPCGMLHKESIYALRHVPTPRLVKVNGKLDEVLILLVNSPSIREALLQRLHAHGDDPKKAFTGKNSLAKNPIYLDEAKTVAVPEEVKITTMETIYTIREEISPGIKIADVVDKKIRDILQARLNEYHGNAKEAFSNLDANPIFLNREKGITIKRVSVIQNMTGVPIHNKHNHYGSPILDTDGKSLPADYVWLQNNHHSAIYIDLEGNLHEKIVSFFEATTRAIQGLPVVDRHYKQDEGWKLLFSIKKNEYFLVPTPDFSPADIDLFNPANAQEISKHLYRVQKISKKFYNFRHHLETSVEEIPELQNSTWLRITDIKKLRNLVKVRLNHIGKIVAVGEEN